MFWSITLLLVLLLLIVFVSIGVYVKVSGYIGVTGKKIYHLLDFKIFSYLELQFC